MRMRVLRWSLLLVALEAALGLDGITRAALYDSQFNLDVELHHEIKTIRPVLQTLDLDGNVRTMSTADGQQYHCLSKSQEEETETGTLDEATKEDAKILSQINTLKGFCFQKRIGYWTYIVCPFERVEQVHYEGQKAGTTFNLGHYSASTSSTLEHMYEGGADKRKSKVVFKCSVGVKDSQVTSIEEPSMHNYEVVVKTPLACNLTQELQAQRIIAGLKGHCLHRVDGWWTYEFCYRKKIRQYHKEKNGDIVEYNLGTYDVPENTKLEKEEVVLFHESPGGKAGYLERYSKGTKCDLTGSYRQTDVVYVCGRTAKIGHIEIVSVKETATCGYTIKVAIPALCNHPHFNDGVDDNLNQVELSTIFCLSNNLYDEVKSLDIEAPEN